jgi:transmembrane sensor
MGNDQDTYIDLILLKKREEGNLTVAEETQIEAWLQASPANRKYYEKMLQFSHKEQEHIPETVTPLHLFRNHIREMNMLHQAQRWRRQWYTIYAISTAAVIAGFMMMVYPVWQNTVKNSAGKATTAIDANSIQLITGDGQVLTLQPDSTATDSMLVNGALVKNETLIYKENNTEKADVHRLKTPPGQKYTVQLPDGSSVWINGASELEYAVPFTGKERKVLLKGEAYFEIAKSTTPFIVYANGAKIQVLGTAFNVNAYHTSLVKTVLVQGSVGVQAGNATVPTVLHPDEMAIIDNNTGTCTVKQTDATAWLAWKTGYFSFHSKQMELVVESIAGYYNFDKVVFKQDLLKKQKISAHIDITREIDEVLKALSDAADINIYEQGGIVYVEENQPVQP